MPPLKFSKFWGDDKISEYLAYQTNLYSTQQTGVSIKTTQKEIDKFFGMQIPIAIAKMNQYKM